MGNRTANKVDSIGNSTFYDNSTIKSVTVPSTVVGVGDYAFSECM